LGTVLDQSFANLGTVLDVNFVNLGTVLDDGFFSRSVWKRLSRSVYRFAGPDERLRFRLPRRPELREETLPKFAKLWSRTVPKFAKFTSRTVPKFTEVMELGRGIWAASALELGLLALDVLGDPRGGVRARARTVRGRPVSRTLARGSHRRRSRWGAVVLGQET
jgi:hypothetical protein